MFAFAERFGRADVLEQDVNVPGWDAQMVYDLTAQYEAIWQTSAPFPVCVCYCPRG